MGKSEILFVNIDRSVSRYASIVKYAIQDQHNILALLVQDCPTHTASISQEAHQGPNTDNPFSVFQQSITTSTPATTTSDLSPATTRFLTLINPEKCVVDKHTEVGTQQACSQMFKIRLKFCDTPTYRVYYLVSTYIRPKATHQHLSKLLNDIVRRCDNKTSRLIIAGDFNASSALWDPQNLIIAEKAASHQSIHRIKTIRGNQIGYFVKKHALTILHQATDASRPTFVNPGRTETDESGRRRAGDSWIDVALAGTKAARVWHDTHIEDLSLTSSTARYHNIIRIRNTVSQQGTATEYTPRYRTSNIHKEHLLEMRLKTSKTRNNWANCSLDKQIEKLNTLTDTVMQQIKHIQETYAKIVSRKKPSISINNILEKLRKMDRRQKRRMNRLKIKRTIWAARQMHKQTRAYQRNKTELVQLIKRRAQGREDEMWTKVNRARRDLEVDGPQANTKAGSIQTTQQLDQLAEKLFPQTVRNIPLRILEQHEPIALQQQELWAAEKAIRNKRYTGPDGIRFSAFNRVIELEPEAIRDIARLCFATGYIPDHCRQTAGTLIPKKAASKFRVVHVATPMAAYLEIIALNRLE